jgi:DNA-binding CsgD family transcriptional regulator
VIVFGRAPDDGSGLLERADVLAVVDDALAACRRGNGPVVAVEGPAGIGKTSVLAVARSRAVEAGMGVLHARASHLERTFSYGVVRQLFEPSVSRADEGERKRLFDGAARHGARLFDPHELEPSTADEDDAFAIVHGLYWLAHNAAEPQPLLVAIDDVHWADPASLRWLSYLARRLEGLPMCVLVTVRTGEGEEPALAELLAEPATAVVRPAPLTVSAVAELIRGGLGAEAEEAFCSACHRATGGNPLLVHELVRTFAAERLAPTADSVTAAERVAPNAVLRSVSVRLSRLPAEAVAVACAIAVLGDGADGTHVATLAGIELRALAAATASLARVQLIQHDEPLRFVHPVVRNAVYGTIATGERAEAHARAAALIVRSRAAPAAVAAQLLEAPPGAVEGAAAILREAAARAATEGSPEATATYLRRCLQEPLRDAVRADVLTALARAEFRLGVPSALDRLSEAVTLIDDPERRSAARLQLARYQIGWNREAEATQTLRRALADQPAAEDDQARRLEAELISVALLNPELQAEAHARLDSLELDASEGPGARFLLGTRAVRETVRGSNRETALIDAERALSDLHELDAEGDWSLGYGRILHVLILGDSFVDARRFIDALVLEARRRGGALHLSSALLWRAVLEHGCGALLDAEADARLALDSHPTETNMETPWVHALAAEVLVERRAAEEAARLIAEYETTFGRSREVSQNTAVLRARAHVALTLGDHRAALDDALAAGRVAQRIGFVNPAVDFGLTWFSEAALARHFLGEEGAARELASEQLELARRWGAPRTLGQALRIAGVVEGGDEGLERLHEAVAVLEPSPARLEYGYALTDLGATLRRRNQRTAAREPLRLALDLAQRGGATLLAARAHEELIASGARPRRPLARGVDALTPSERRVARMAAEGRSNREIAQALFVTLRTVETHLSSSFRKLGLSSRTQLPAVLAGVEDGAGGISR